MARKLTADEERKAADDKQTLATIQRWTPAELLAVKHLGPAIIGEEMYKASQMYDVQTSGGVHGPAILGIIPDAYKDQRPVKKDDGA